LNIGRKAIKLRELGEFSPRIQILMGDPLPGVIFTSNKLPKQLATP
jgi:hypothetical protein